MKIIASQNKKKPKDNHYEKSEMKKGENLQAHPDTETIQVDEFIPESIIVKNKGKYHPGKTRHTLAMILVISLLICMVIFGILHAAVDKEMIESLMDFSRYSITILSSLTGAAIGFYFGRDIKD